MAGIRREGNAEGGVRLLVRLLVRGSQYVHPWT
jgi:hypothetical protein